MNSNFRRLYKEKNRKNERSHRANVLVELRNERREDILQKKRLEPTNGNIPISYDNNTLETAINMCQSDNLDDRALGILTLRSAIYSDTSQCEMIVCKPMFISLMINLLEDSHNSNIQFDAACVLANLTIKYSNIRQLLTEDQTFKILFKYLDPLNGRLCETILWTIANIIQDNPKSISLLISNNILGICQQIISVNPPVHILRNISYLLLNFTAKNVIAYSMNPGILSLVLPIVKHLLKVNEDKVLANILWVIANINDTNVENIALVIESGVLQMCKDLLTQSPNECILHPALRIFGNIVTNDDEITQYALDMGLFTIVSSFIHYDSSIIQRECLWFISNIAAGNNSQMTIIFENNLIEHIIDRLMNGTKIVVREALWVISNILYTSKPSQVQILLKIGLIEYICKILKHSKDPEVLNLCLECFNFSFDNSGLVWTEICTQIELHGGIESIESLQNHQNKRISETATFIIDQYIYDYDSTFNDEINDDWNDKNCDESNHMYDF